VTGGTFFRTYKNSGVGPTGEADPATVSDFRFDKYLVTVGRFRQFVAAWRGGYYPSAGSGIHTYLNDGHGLENSGPGAAYETGWDATDWNNTTDIDPTTANLTTACNDPKFATWTATNENLPIDCLTWYEAYAFCIWDGGFLPSQAEREYAAAGGSQQREYPWGSATPGTACPGTGCDYAIYNCEFPSGPAVCSGVANIAPVGYASQGVGRWGQVDLAGEVYEWTLDVLQGLGGFTGHFPTAPCTNCAATVSNAAEPYRIIGGDDFHDAKAFLVAARNEGGDMTVRSYGIGLRCARTP
jgi:formylglycine-generating enzyme required for sulfatase activity